MMTPRLREKLDRLAVLVKNEWPGEKLRVTEAWDEDGEHTPTSVHYEGSGADITVSDKDNTKLGRLGKLAVDAGFDRVWYENAIHVHVSVKPDTLKCAPSASSPTPEPPTPTPTATPTPSPTPTIQPVSVGFEAASCTFLSRSEFSFGVSEDFDVTISGTATGPVGATFALAWSITGGSPSLDEFTSSWTRLGGLSSARRESGDPETATWSKRMQVNIFTLTGNQRGGTVHFTVNIASAVAYSETSRTVAC